MSFFICKGYYREGFLSVQYAVDQAIMRAYKGDSSVLTYTRVILSRFPYPAFIYDVFVLAIQNQLPLMLVLSFTYISLNIVRSVVQEKERKLKVCLRAIIWASADETHLCLLLGFFLFSCAFLGVHEDDGPQQLAPLECLVPHVLSLYLHFSLSCHSAPLYPGEFVLKMVQIPARAFLATY